MKLAFLCAVAATTLTYMFSPVAVSASEYAKPPVDFAQRILDSHNRERVRMGLAPLRWSARLSGEARQWASSLARGHSFAHSDAGRDAGENLWTGSANGFSPEQIVASFLAERRAFQPGRFPNVSHTGDWSDVGHYTQIIWPETKAVGCALARNRGHDVMVCRYWPAGNVFGQPVG